MSTQASLPRCYVRAGPFNLGVYAAVPTHEFKECGAGVWRCLHCTTIVSTHRKDAAEHHACDGSSRRCAICNGLVGGYQRMNWAGLICRACDHAHQDALTVRPAPQAVAP